MMEIKHPLNLTIWLIWIGFIKDQGPTLVLKGGSAYCNEYALENDSKNVPPVSKEILGVLKCTKFAGISPDRRNLIFWDYPSVRMYSFKSRKSKPIYKLKPSSGFSDLIWNSSGTKAAFVAVNLDRQSTLIVICLENRKTEIKEFNISINYFCGKSCSPLSDDFWFDSENTINYKAPYYYEDENEDSVKVDSIRIFD